MNLVCTVCTVIFRNLQSNIWFKKIFFKSKASVKFLFGGRGLIAGCAVALKTMNPKIKIIVRN